jgi:hypothetical protein
MTQHEIAIYRLLNQRIAYSTFKDPVDVVSALGAMQAQDYLGALWAVGLRLPVSTESVVEQAISDGKIIRTWPLRGTLHFTAAEDVRWMLSLSGPRIIAGSAGRHKQLELNNADLNKSQDLIVDALRGGVRLTREALFQVLRRGGIPTTGQRGIHILQWLALQGLICFGPREEKKPTFVLLDEWVPKTPELERDQALAELARRYFTGHGPATLRDFVWWSGLKVSDARIAVEMATSGLGRESVDGEVYWMPREMPDLNDADSDAHLLPGFDQYLLGYKDRSAVLSSADASKIAPGANGMFLSTIVIDGRVSGSWKRTVKKKSVDMKLNLFAPLKKAEIRAVVAAAERYGRFIDAPVELSH